VVLFGLAKFHGLPNQVTGPTKSTGPQALQIGPSDLIGNVNRLNLTHLPAKRKLMKPHTK